jgi:bifunctional DNA-binding transcriptional regulator/antitoxin component of YhaV-PrlF toxin-antitoxin module
MTKIMRLGGHDSYGVVIPRAIVDKMRIKPGDVVSFVPEGKGVLRLVIAKAEDIEPIREDVSASDENKKKVEKKKDDWDLFNLKW